LTRSRADGSALDSQEVAMQFEFNVGTHEQHRVAFAFNQMVGDLKITVDGQPVVQDLRMFSLRLVKRYEFSVGQPEPYKVAIEKERKLLLAGFRKQK
jgi:hypothetical protein